MAAVERAALALLGGGLAVVPHVVRREQLRAALEGIEQGNRPARPDERCRWVDLDHRQPPAGSGNRIARTGVRLLALPQFVYLRLPGATVDNRWHSGMTVTSSH